MNISLLVALIATVLLAASLVTAIVIVEKRIPRTFLRELGLLGLTVTLLLTVAVGGTTTLLLI